MLRTPALGLLLLCAGCASTDPLRNADVWHPSGVNETNIAAQVAQPIDLVQGREATGGTSGELAAAAILRLRTGHVKTLPDSSVSDVHVQGSGSTGGGS